MQVTTSPDLAPIFQAMGDTVVGAVRHQKTLLVVFVHHGRRVRVFALVDGIGLSLLLPDFFARAFIEGHDQSRMGVFIPGTVNQLQIQPFAIQ